MDIINVESIPIGSVVNHNKANYTLMARERNNTRYRVTLKSLTSDANIQLNMPAGTFLKLVDTPDPDLEETKKPNLRVV